VCCIEKIIFLNGIFPEAEKDRSQGSIRNVFRIIKKCRSFNPILKAVKNSEGTTELMEPQNKITDGDWWEYFADLLNGTILPNAMENANI